MRCQPNSVLIGSESSPVFAEKTNSSKGCDRAALERRELATVGLRGRVLGVLLCERCEVGAALDLVVELLCQRLVLHEDVAHLPRGRLLVLGRVLVVVRLDVGVARR